MFKKLFSKNKISKEDKDPKIFLLYSVDKDGHIDLDFRFDVDSIESNELFSEMFHQLNSGQLLTTSSTFVYKTLKQIDPNAAKEFIDNIEILNKVSNNIILNSITKTSEANPPSLNDEIVVKPSEIAQNVLGGEKS